VRLSALLTKENFKMNCTNYLIKRGSPKGVDPCPVGHAPPREEVRLRTAVKRYKNFQLQLYRSAGLAVNYPALADGASPPRDEDFLLLRATSIPLHPQRRFHRTEPFCNAPCGRGVTEGLLSTGVSSPSPEGTTSALTARGLCTSIFITIKRFL